MAKAYETKNMLSCSFVNKLIFAHDILCGLFGIRHIENTCWTSEAYTSLLAH